MSKRAEGDKAPDVFDLPPRCNGHEGALARAYGLDEVRPIGLRAAWAWLKSLFCAEPALVHEGSRQPPIQLPLQP